MDIQMVCARFLYPSFHTADVDKSTIDLGVKNPHEPETEELKSPEEILEDIKEIDKEVAEILESIKL